MGLVQGIEDKLNRLIILIEGIIMLSTVEINCQICPSPRKAMHVQSDGIYIALLLNSVTRELKLPPQCRTVFV